VAKNWAWWKLPQSMKDLLQSKRQQSMFGGESAVGAGRAPYFWAQDFGSEAASIRPQNIVHGPEGAFERTLPAFRRIATEGISG